MPQILLIEDDSLIQRALETKLLKHGFEVIACSNGKEGLEQLARLTPDIVLTDLMMPYISGLEIVSHVKANKPGIPVIVFSSMGQEKTVEEAFELGADDYITKPFSLTEVLIRINKQIRNK